MIYIFDKFFGSIDDVNIDVDDFVDAYILHKKELSGELKKTRGIDNSWSSVYMDYIIEFESERFFEIMSLIRKKESSIEMLYILAAGPIEDMLSASSGHNHGLRIISTLETLAHNDPECKEAFSIIMPRGIPKDIWNRLQEAICPTNYPNRKARRKEMREKSKKMLVSDYRKK